VPYRSWSRTMTPILETKALTKRFGGLTAINDLTLTVERGELRCLLGPNGAGKTTLFNLITGRERPSAGEIYFDGRQLTGVPIHEIARLGIGRKFQIPNIYEHLSVADNLVVALQHSLSVGALLRHGRRGAGDDRILAILDDISLGDKRHLPATHLSHGEKQWLEIGMVLASRPQLLLFDEPTAGMTADETRKTVTLLQQLSARQLTMLVIGHDMHFIRAIARGVTVLHKGRVVAEGDIGAIERDPVVRDVYLGKA
jgi:urea transport system ATP-binding protein